jgi:hypothetical protein
MLTCDGSVLYKIDKLSHLFSGKSIIFECLFTRGKLA